MDHQIWLRQRLVQKNSVKPVKKINDSFLNDDEESNPDSSEKKKTFSEAFMDLLEEDQD